MPITVRPILPKKLPVRAQAALSDIQAGLRLFALDLVKEMQQYPPRLPWKYPPTSGPYKGGKRTGTLGRNWRFDLTPGRVRVYNAIFYAGYVQGYSQGVKGQRQTAVMAARGWQSVSVIGHRVWDRHVPGIKLRLARVRR